MEFLNPIIVLNLIVGSLAVMLVVADRFLAQYGECKILINGEKELMVRGGNSLLASLMDNEIFIPSACGGKGTCGYCRVRIPEGGGAVLPTEEPFLTREQLIDGYRLACQVKVRDDMEIRIPDFLEVVQNIVKNRTYDPTRGWRFIVE